MDLLYKLRSNLHNRVSDYVKGRQKSKTLSEALGCSFEHLRFYLEKQFLPGMTWKNYGSKGWHIDHIVPLSVAQTAEEVLNLCHYTNLQPLWAIDNYKKSNRVTVGPNGFGIELRLVEKTDLDNLRKWRQSPEVSAYMYTSPKITPEDQLLWYAKIRREYFEGKSIYYIVQDSTTKEEYGFVSITDLKSLHGAFWAYYLFPNVPRGQGLGSKIEYLLIDFAFNQLQCRKLRCEVLASNEPVLHIHTKKFGFKQEAYYRSHVVKNDESLDVYGLAILKEEWDELKHAIYEKLKSRGY